ncbi:MAG: HAD-IC family P-type ATPase [Desulfobulbaceae bacterium]|nr:HAD-IC family P-type ATPase [Desulfobulbaceae bacterium]
MRDGAIFQKLEQLTDLFFDKTGTITTGKFSVLQQSVVDDADQKTSSELIGSLEKASNHPIATAIVNYCSEKNLQLHPVNDVLFYDGLGVKGVVNGNEVFAGNRSLFETCGIALPQHLIDCGGLEELKGNTVIFYHIVELKNFGMFVLGDQLNAHAATTIAKLQKNKLMTYMISGDSENTTRTIAAKVGISNYFSELSPEDKIGKIQKAQSSNHVIGMVGDGINDAPSLAQADIGIAIGSGTELAIESSDIILLENTLEHVWDCYDISKRTIKTIKQNLVWAVLYNSIGLVAAVLGYLNPLMAATAMLISSLSVVLNSLRLYQGSDRTR